jgi:hypothetical protein
MPIFSVPKSRRFKHAASRSIDWGNGATRNLVAAWKVESGASVVDSVRGVTLARTGTASIITGPNGARTRIDATGECFRIVTPTHLRIQPPLTLMIAGIQTGNPDNYATLGGCMADNADVSPYYSYAIYNHPNTYSFGCNNGSFVATISGVSTYTAGTSRWLAGTVSSSGGISLYVDSIASPTTNSLGGSISYSTNSSIGLGEAWAASARNPNFDHDYMYVWNRALSTFELDAIRRDPYQIFSPLRQSTVITFGGIGGVTAAYAATLGDLSFAGVAARTLPANATGTYAATLGNLTAALTASFTAAPNRTATYAATLGDTVFAGVASRTLPANATGTYAATLGDTTFAGVAARTLPANASATYAATLGDLTFAGVSSVGGAGSATATYTATLGSLALDAVANRSIPGIGFEPVGVSVAVRPKGSRYRFPAQTRVNINSANPLARHVQWLAAPGISRIEATKGRTGFLTTSASASWAADGKYGLCLDSTSQSNGGAYWLSPQLSLGTSYTLGMLCKLDTLSSVGQQKIICVPYRNDSSWSSPFAGLGWYAVATTGAWGHEYSTTTPTRISQEGGSGYFDTEWHYYVMVRNGANLTFYRDGSQHSTGTLGTNSAPDLSNGAGAHFGQRSYLNNGEGMDGKMAIGWIMDRALTASEIDYMYEDPWSLIVSRKNWAPVIASGQALPVTYSATLGNTTLAGVSSVGAAGSAAATYTATLGNTVFAGVAARTLPASAAGTYAATLGNTTLAGVASTGAAGSATATYAATLGSLVFAGTATFTAAPARSATYAATLGNTVFAGVASRALPPNRTATFAATLGSVVFAGVVFDSSSLGPPYTLRPSGTVITLSPSGTRMEIRPSG